MQCSINARIVFGSAGKYAEPFASQNAWKMAPSAFWARNVFFAYARCAIASHSTTRSNRAGDFSWGHLVSRPGELHPQPRAEPYVTLARHTAPIIEAPERACTRQ